jgi:hypothetical protein
VHEVPEDIEMPYTCGRVQRCVMVGFAMCRLDRRLQFALAGGLIMRVLVVAIAVVLALSSVAAAGPRRYVESEIGLGGIGPGGLGLLVQVGGDYRVWHLVHVHAAYSHAVRGGARLEGDPGAGYGNQLRAGAEVIPCTEGGIVCGNFGLDLGVQRGTWQSETSDGKDFSGTVDSAIAMPRAFLDIGSSTVRFRLGIELGFGIASHVVAHTGGPELMGAPGSAGLVAGVAVQW